MVLLTFVAGLLLLVVTCGARAHQQPEEPPLPTPTATVAITVLPTATGVLEAELRPTKTPQPPLVLNDVLPRATATRVPTNTPTATPEPTGTPARPPVQKGELWNRSTRAS